MCLSWPNAFLHGGLKLGQGLKSRGEVKGQESTDSKGPTGPPTDERGKVWCIWDSAQPSEGARSWRLELDGIKLHEISQRETNTL